MPTIQQLVRKGRETLVEKTWRLRTCLHYDSEET